MSGLKSRKAREKKDDALLKHVLILGGTRDAFDLAERLHQDDGPACRVTTSLAGRTRRPARPAGEIRQGGFGGIDGLVSYLDANSVDAVIDATHPFAAQISRHAVAACKRVDVPLLRFDRPAWTAQDGDNWHHVPDLEAAAALLPKVGKTAFLTIGVQELSAFYGVGGVALAIRMIDPPQDPGRILPQQETVLILGKGPFDLSDERALLEKHRIDVLVTKNSGGELIQAKLIAAREAGLPVIMVDRPPKTAALEVFTLDAVLDWLKRQPD